MLVNDKEAAKRLNSPMNLFNQMRTGALNPAKNRAMNLFGMNKKSETKIEHNPFALAAPSSQDDENDAENQEGPQSTAISGTVVDDNESVSIDHIIGGAEARIKLETAHNIALDTLVASVQQIKIHLPAMDNPGKLADVAVKMSKIVNDIRTEKNKTQSDRPVHLHFYTPEQRKLTDYQEVTV